jgi:hypothetical protein
MTLIRRTIHVWGYFALSLGCLLVIGQVFAVIVSRRLYTPTLVPSALLSVLFISIGVESIRAGRRSDSNFAIPTLAGQTRTVWRRCSARLSLLPTKLDSAGITADRCLRALGIVQAVIGLLSFAWVGSVILAGAAYLGVGPAAIPILLLCLCQSAVGISIAVSPNVGSCGVAAIWDLLLGLFFLFGVMTESDSGLGLLLPAISLISVSVAFMFLSPSTRARDS